MRRQHLRRVGTAALLALLLAGCGDSTGDGPEEGPATSEAAATTTSDVAPTTDDPAEDSSSGDGAGRDDQDGDDQSGDTAATTGSTGDDAATSTSEPTGPEAPTSLEPAPTETAAPTPSDPPADPGQGSCADDTMSQDILGFTGGVAVDFCEDGWALAAYPGAPGQPEFIAQHSGGQWFHAVAMGDPVCQDDLAARGAPASISGLLPSCDGEAAPTSEPEPTPPPAGSCTIGTALYGPTSAELVGVSCEEATAEWQVAEASDEPSWTIPVTTPGGWECYVTPYDQTSAAAGSCYGPDGSSYFTLYVP